MALFKKKKPEVKQEVKKEKKGSKTAYKVLTGVRITEKATALQKDNSYVFKINPESTKMEIKKAVESLYNVNVVKVNLMNIKRRKKRLGRTTGWKQGYKKAVVFLKKGTSAPGILADIGPHLKNTQFSMFRPTKVKEILQS